MDRIKGIGTVENQRVVVSRFGGPEVLELVTDPALPVPGEGEVRIRVLVTSAAFTDVMIRKGKYPDVKEKPPFTLGYDLVGVVDAIGPGVQELKVGQRVADLTVTGSYANYVCRPESDLTPVPENLESIAALGMILSGVTPYQMLHRVAQVESGQSILIHGAAGAVGTMMLQLARLSGVRAFGSDIPAKHDVIAKLGATPIDATARDLETEIGNAVGEGVDVVFDPLGGASLPRSLRVLRPGGLLVAFGFHGAVMGHGGNIPLDFIKLKLWDWLPNARSTRFYSITAMRHRHPDWFKEDLRHLFRLLAEGKISPVIAEVLPLSAAQEAHRLIEAGKASGKIVLRVSDDPER